MSVAMALGCGHTPANNDICQSAHTILLHADIDLGFAIEKLDASTATCPEISRHISDVALTLYVYRAALEPQRSEPSVRRLIEVLEPVKARDLVFACDGDGLSPEWRKAFRANLAKVRSLIQDALTGCPIER
jgi:hypothetical protein